nr:hypothetical protein CFP56_32262 [Quercus suber]
MVEIQILSDLHLESPKAYDIFEIVPKAPYLALLGDIGNVVSHKEECLSFLNRQLEQFKAVLFVPGNHEAYGSTWSTTLEVLREFERDVTERRAVDGSGPSPGRFVVMDRNDFQLVTENGEHIVFLGCSLFSLIPPYHEMAVEMGLQDFYQTLSWDVRAHNEAHGRDLTWLNEPETPPKSDHVSFRNRFVWPDVLHQWKEGLLLRSSRKFQWGGSREALMATICSVLALLLTGPKIVPSVDSVDMRRNDRCSSVQSLEANRASTAQPIVVHIPYVIVTCRCDENQVHVTVPRSSNGQIPRPCSAANKSTLTALKDLSCQMNHLHQRTAPCNGSWPSQNCQSAATGPERTVAYILPAARQLGEPPQDEYCCYALKILELLPERQGGNVSTECMGMQYAVANCLDVLITGSGTFPYTARYIMKVRRTMAQGLPKLKIAER